MRVTCIVHQGSLVHEQGLVARRFRLIVAVTKARWRLARVMLRGVRLGPRATDCVL